MVPPMPRRTRATRTKPMPAWARAKTSCLSRNSLIASPPVGLRSCNVRARSRFRSPFSRLAQKRDLVPARGGSRYVGQRRRAIAVLYECLDAQALFTVAPGRQNSPQSAALLQQPLDPVETACPRVVRGGKAVPVLDCGICRKGQQQAHQFQVAPIGRRVQRQASPPVLDV